MHRLLQSILPSRGAEAEAYPRSDFEADADADVAEADSDVKADPLAVPRSYVSSGLALARAATYTHARDKPGLRNGWMK